MTRHIGVCLLALALSAPALASAGAKRHVPGQVLTARYVCLGYDAGDGFLSETASISAPFNVYPEDRQVLNAVRDQLEKWGRYVVTVRPEDAELLIGVRAGRLVGTSGGVGIGVGSGGGRIANMGAGRVEVSSPWDTFTVYDARSGGQLWRVQKKGALAGSPPAAFEEFKQAVENAPAPKKEKDKAKDDKDKTEQKEKP